MTRQQEEIKNGFTLIELIVSMAIFSLVMITVLDIFLSGLGGVERIFGVQSVQESGRFMMESIAKEIRMSKLNSADGLALTSLPDGVSGPYYSLNVTNPNSQSISYVFDDVAKQVARAGEILNSNDVEVAGRFYLVKNGAMQPRVIVSFGLINKTSQAKSQTSINLQTTVSSREYYQ